MFIKLNANVAVISPAASNAGLVFSDVSPVETAAGAFLCVRKLYILFHLAFVFINFLFCLLWFVIT